MTGRHRRRKISKTTMWIFRMVVFALLAIMALLIYAALFID